MLSNHHSHRGNGAVMKVPFRQQASEYDCVPTSLINALVYLFGRKEIPPFVVQRVYKDCLDYESARGTSGRAIQDLGFWLNCYNEKSYVKFTVETKYIFGEQVHLRRNSRIIKCLNANGAALLCVHLSRYEWHCILGIRYERGWLYCYDPYPRTMRFINNDAVQFISTTGHHEPNLKIRMDWLDKEFNQAVTPDDRKYILGDYDDRECLLLNRIRE